jgi:hypothetical protein
VLSFFFSSLPTVPVLGFGSVGATVLVPLLENFGFKFQYFYDRYQNSMFNSILKTSAHLFGISPSTAKFLATYIINLFFITSSPMSCSSRLTHRECYQMTLYCLNTDLTKQALDDSNFATNPEQVIDNVIKKLLPD